MIANGKTDFTKETAGSGKSKKVLNPQGKHLQERKPGKSLEEGKKSRPTKAVVEKNL